MVLLSNPCTHVCNMFYFGIYVLNCIFVFIFLSDIHNPPGDGHSFQQCNCSSSWWNVLPSCNLELLSSPRPPHQKNLREAYCFQFSERWVDTPEIFEYSSSTAWTKWIYKSLFLFYFMTILFYVSTILMYLFSLDVEGLGSWTVFLDVTLSSPKRQINRQVLSVCL